MRDVEASRALRAEVERRIRDGQCVYCRARPEPDRPLTREHLIPIARGGRRKDAAIIVPACARCNHLRGCQELVGFLLARPRRISAFLDYLWSLPQESVRRMDPRVFADLLTAVWILSETVERGGEWRRRLERLSRGRALHRRRYAARRVVGSASDRLARQRERGGMQGGPSCLIPEPSEPMAELGLDESTEWIRVRLLAVLSLAWHAPAEKVPSELPAARGVARSDEGEGDAGELDGPVERLDGRPGRKRRRLRIDGRRGRGVRAPSGVSGRAA